MATFDNFVVEFCNQYAQGNFIMGDSDNEFRCNWCTSTERFIIPLDNLIVSKRLRRKIRNDQFTVSMNKRLVQVVEGCSNRDKTWINPSMKFLYRKLFETGIIHSVETWKNGTLVGGLFGVALDRVFFGESMFSIENDASKIALVYLVDHLNNVGFNVLDAQVPSEHLIKMGGVQISEEKFKRCLNKNISCMTSQFTSAPLASSGLEVVQRINQKS